MRLIVKTGAVLIILTVMITQAVAYEEVEDLIDIFATDNKFVAVVAGRRQVSDNRRLSENILWEGARGEIGAFLTSERLLAVSVNSGKWNIRFLKINEKKKTPEMLIGAHLVLMLTDERVLAFGSHTDGFFQTRLPLGESILAKEAEGRVAAVITRSRAFGFSSFRRGEAEIRLRQRESVISLNATYNKITLRTTQRLITLEATDAVWREFDLKY